MSIRAIAFLAVGLVAAAGLPAAEVELPVTKVSAFSSGVAYYEHSGAIQGDAVVLLKFKADQINDMLKSLVLLDAGGDVTGVSYASQEPLARALKSFAIDLSGNPPLSAMLEQVRGAEVSLTAPDKITGKILSVEARNEQIMPANIVRQVWLLNILTDSGIRSIRLENITSVSLVDEKLTAELNKALQLLIQSRDTQLKPVQVNFTGKGERRVSIGYVAEAPIWKTSYRLVLGDEPADEPGKAPAARAPATASAPADSKFHMQGWAILENTSDFDWDKVDLTLISGRPISFVQDLYTPLYVPRPVVQPELYASLRPPDYIEGMDFSDKMDRRKAVREDLAKKAESAEKADRAGGPGAPRAAAAAAPAKPGDALAGRALADMPAQEEEAKSARYRAEVLQRGVQSVAAAAQVGELFSYHIKTPVSLARRKSAMLPIINEPVRGRGVSIYNANVLARNPLRGMWLTNSTKLSLLAGPVTVYDEGTYGGDARIDNMGPGDKRLLSYAIDLDVTVDPSSSSSQKITDIRIVRGVLHVTRRNEYSRTYAIKNKDDRKRQLIIEHPRNNALKLVQPAEPGEKTPELYRFETEVPAEKTAEFKVVEEQMISQTVAILPADVGALQFYVTSGEVPGKVKDALAEAVKRKNEMVAADREAADLQQQIDRLRQEQAQVRANMQVLDKNSVSFQTFEKKLMEQEKQIEALQAKREEAIKRAKDLREKLEDYLNKLNVE